MPEREHTIGVLGDQPGIFLARDDEGRIYLQNGEGNRFCSLTELSGLTGRHPVALRRLLERGRIEGVKAFGFWLATEQAVEAYEAQKSRRGRPIGSRNK